MHQSCCHVHRGVGELVAAVAPWAVAQARQTENLRPAGRASIAAIAASQAVTLQ